MHLCSRLTYIGYYVCTINIVGLITLDSGIGAAMVSRKEGAHCSCLIAGNPMANMGYMCIFNDTVHREKHVPIWCRLTKKPHRILRIPREDSVYMLTKTVPMYCTSSVYVTCDRHEIDETIWHFVSSPYGCILFHIRYG